ncbi:hypothetical protein STIAU_1377, partial [Stigmatella aurantiaca DW4/3-1]
MRPFLRVPLAEAMVPHPWGASIPWTDGSPCVERPNNGA